MRSPFPARHRLADQTGSVTAEFAAAMPAVVLVLACCLAAIQLAGAQLRLQDAASTIVRTLARDSGNAGSGNAGGSVAELRDRLIPGARLTTEDRGELICIRLSTPGIIGGGLSVVTLSASSCALSAGR
jgi:hypothetical protein